MLSNPEKHQESVEEQKIFEDIVNGVVFDVEPYDINSVDEEFKDT